MAGLSISTNTGKTADAFGKPPREASKPGAATQVVASSASICQIPHLLLHIKLKCLHPCAHRNISHVTAGLCFEVKAIFKPLHETFSLL